MKLKDYLCFTSILPTSSMNSLRFFEVAGTPFFYWLSTTYFFNGVRVNRKRCEPLPVFWSGKWHCAIGEKQKRLSFPDSFSLVRFFLDEQKEMNI